MSDFSRLEQSFALPSQPSLAAADEYTRYEPPPPTELQPHEVGFTRLRGAREIARVLHLREQIALPASAVDDPGFHTREKKETSRASSAPSPATASTSARSATCR
ncbi:MAG TPA: hypothetical protein VGD76_07915 [Ramlibacter sp.]